MYLKNVLVILVVITTINAVKKSYDGYTLYKIVPQDDSEVSILGDVQASGLGEFWSENVVIKHDVKVMVSPEKREEFLQILETGNIEAIVLINDVQKAIDDQLKPVITRASNSYLSFSWSVYHNLDTIYKWLDELQTNHPNVAKTVVMGKSVENRDIKGIIINHNPGKQNPLIGVIEGTLHAREWISAATVTWIIKEFLTSTNPEIRALAETFEWHIFPVVNPDGYVYTFTDNRMWRKNRSPESAAVCAAGVDDDMSHGVDLNRNFDYVWMSVGASNDSCTNTFAGPRAFSEPETQAISQYMMNLNTKGDIIYYIAFHSYTQLIIMPYSHVSSEDALLSGNYGDMYEIAIRSADAVKQRFGTEYRVGLSANVMYAMSGTSFDWVKLALNVPITYLFELRDLGEFGFLLPADQIVPTSLETMDGLVQMDKTTRNLRYYSSGANSIFCSAFVVVMAVAMLLVN